MCSEGSDVIPCGPTLVRSSRNVGCTIQRRKPGQRPTAGGGSLAPSKRAARWRSRRENGCLAAPATLLSCRPPFGCMDTSTRQEKKERRWTANTSNSGTECSGRCGCPHYLLYLGRAACGGDARWNLDSGKAGWKGGGGVPVSTGLGLTGRTGSAGPCTSRLRDMESRDGHPTGGAHHRRRLRCRYSKVTAV